MGQKKEKHHVPQCSDNRRIRRSRSGAAASEGKRHEVHRSVRCHAALLEERAGRVDFQDRVAPGGDRPRLAEFVLANVKKGSHVLVEGSLISSTYERGNGKGRKAETVKATSWSIRADSVRKLDRDFLRGTIEVAESFSNGQFGTPKTKSSRRVIPMSASLRDYLEAHKLRCKRTGSEELVFCTATGTPLSTANLYTRVLAPTCDRIGLSRVSWHSFRHTNATLLGEVGESVKTAQSILGHSDLETTLNTYMHAIPNSQRRAVERVAGVVFPDVPKSVPVVVPTGRLN
jgi:Phage integrase family/Single-strand binding protein family